MNETCALKSSVGRKALMAVTGFLLLGFVMGHLAGNLLIFLGPDALNAYAKKLQDLGPGLWLARSILLSALLLHIGLAVKLTMENREARPIPYEHKASIATTLAAKTMMISGLLLLAYIIYHLLHFTFKSAHPEITHFIDSHGRHDVYSMVVLSFQKTAISITYILAMALLCFHLGHGIASMFQSVGLTNEKLILCLRKISWLFSFLIFAGYISIPLAVLAGWIKPIGGA